MQLIIRHHNLVFLYGFWIVLRDVSQINITDPVIYCSMLYACIANTNIKVFSSGPLLVLLLQSEHF